MRAAVAIAVSLGVLGALPPAEAQPAATAPRIGVLGVTPSNPILAEAFKHGLAEFGYVEGRLPQLGAELARTGVDSILARGAGAVSAAKQAST